MSETEKPKEKMETGGGKKRVRQRKLSLYDNIRKQMEFYFSTPNLQKDRFLKKLVMSDPEGFVELEMFLNFNKIKSLTTDLACIAKAIKESKTLTVDETGKKIKRKCKFEEPQDTDQRTVYAEFLPKDATIDWLIKHFSLVGKVVHVSLPKYKSTGDIKGFAFVEFETVEAAAKACRLLNCPSEKVSASKPGIFAKTFKTGRHMKKALQQDSADPEAMETGGNAPEVKVECEDRIEEDKMEVEGATSCQDAHLPKDKTKKKKRKRSESFSRQKESKPSEDAKPDAIEELVKPDTTKDDGELDASKEDVVDRNKSRKKRKRSESCETVDHKKVEKLEEPEDVQESTTKKKKPKSAKAKEEVKDGEQNDAKKSETVVESSEPDRSGTENTPKKKPAKKKAKQGVEQRKEGLRVISKQEWLEYRQDYYQRHKQNMSELKMKIREIKGKQTTDDQPKTTLVGNGDLSEEVSNHPIKKEEGLTFVPSVIIKVTLAEPVSKKFLKEHMSGSGKVAFLDMIEGDLTAHARCEDVDSAATILKASTGECQYTLLQGEEEKTYWDKVFSDREKRLSTKTKKKVRGNDKILAKADKVLKSMKEKAVHIVFDD